MLLKCWGPLFCWKPEVFQDDFDHFSILICYVTTWWADKEEIVCIMCYVFYVVRFLYYPVNCISKSTKYTWRRSESKGQSSIDIGCSSGTPVMATVMVEQEEDEMHVGCPFLS